MPIDFPIETKSCQIRSYVESDIVQLAEVEFDPIVKKYIGLPDKSKETWIAGARLSLFSGWAIESLLEKEFAGSVSLDKANRSFGLDIMELRIVISRKYWGRGFGREVAEKLLPLTFSKLQTKAVIAEVHPDNEASLKLLLHFGFTFTNPSEKKPMQIYTLGK